ncbi:MAG: flagellar biosynthetic protein FliO [Desulforegulaceae bacterium]|jgi:flagellar protein FliO/FliZ|nr:flagellar biosynthetic protein FliO [Desulforegulaceae bacterium]
MEPGSVNLYAELFKTFGMLAIVLGIIVGALYFVKKFMAKNFSMGESAKIKLLSSFYLGSREKLVIVDVEGEKLLIGVTKENISLISKLGKNDESAKTKEESQSDFSEIFKKNLKNRFFLKKEKKE